MGILSWIIVGGLAGWLASMVMGTNERQGCIMDIVLGIVGALVGGFLLSAIGMGGDMSGINIGSIITAFIGAVIVIFIWRAISGRSRR
ncbi:MAG TPA: GlsB/YeaQ/YmgE family stress response membrane protein [Ardenticatenaceae bacterium]|jgi:uncharacterized membrane protein YeaQ/YmgE (transglycosylase-associated protein family)